MTPSSPAHRSNPITIAVGLAAVLLLSFGLVVLATTADVGAAETEAAGQFDSCEGLVGEGLEACERDIGVGFMLWIVGPAVLLFIVAPLAVLVLVGVQTAGVIREMFANEDHGVDDLAPTG